MAGDKFYTSTNLDKGQAPEQFRGSIEDVVTTAMLANKLGILEPKDNIKLLANSLVENRSDLGNNGGSNPDYAYDKLAALAEQGDKLAEANIDNYSVQSMLASLQGAKRRGAATGRDTFEAWNGLGKARDASGNIVADASNHMSKVNSMVEALQLPQNASLLGKFNSLTTPDNSTLLAHSEATSAESRQREYDLGAPARYVEVSDNLRDHPDILAAPTTEGYAKLGVSFDQMSAIVGNDNKVIALTRLGAGYPSYVAAAQRVLGKGETAVLRARLKDPNGETAVLSNWTPSLLDELATHVRNIKNSTK